MQIYKKNTKWQKPNINSPNFNLSMYTCAHTRPEFVITIISVVKVALKQLYRVLFYRKSSISVRNLTKKLCLLCFQEKELHKALKSRYLSKFFCVVFYCWRQD